MIIIYFDTQDVVMAECLPYGQKSLEKLLSVLERSWIVEGQSVTCQADLASKYTSLRTYYVAIPPTESALKEFHFSTMEKIQAKTAEFLHGLTESTITPETRKVL